MPLMPEHVRHMFTNERLKEVLDRVNFEPMFVPFPPRHPEREFDVFWINPYQWEDPFPVVVGYTYRMVVRYEPMERHDTDPGPFPTFLPNYKPKPFPRRRRF